MCSKHVEAWNELIIKFSASRWLILINKYIEMHGQQNIKNWKNICPEKKGRGRDTIGLCKLPHEQYVVVLSNSHFKIYICESFYCFCENPVSDSDWYNAIPISVFDCLNSCLHNVPPFDKRSPLSPFNNRRLPCHYQLSLMTWIQNTAFCQKN